MTDTTRKDALQHPMTNVERNALADALTAIVKRNSLAHDNAARAHRRRMAKLARLESETSKTRSQLFREWFKHAADEIMGVKK